jgi:hypothetical protein
VDGGGAGEKRLAHKDLGNDATDGPPVRRGELKCMGGGGEDLGAATRGGGLGGGRGCGRMQCGGGARWVFA